MVCVGCARVSDRAKHFGGLAVAAHGMVTISSHGGLDAGSPVVGPRAIILHVFQSTSANTSFTSSNYFNTHGSVAAKQKRGTNDGVIRPTTRSHLV
jgi:hypothetical protein